MGYCFIAIFELAPSPYILQWGPTFLKQSMKVQRFHNNIANHRLLLICVDVEITYFWLDPLHYVYYLSSQ